jgi:hypothetical protein
MMRTIEVKELWRRCDWCNGNAYAQWDEDGNVHAHQPCPCELTVIALDLLLALEKSWNAKQK